MQAILVMPAIIFSFAAAILLWETVNIRRDLHYGTFQAMRYLSLYPPKSTLESDWAGIAQKYVEAELLSNPWVTKPLNEANLDVDVTLYDSNQCGDEFLVDATYKMFAPVGSLDDTGLGAILPNMIQLQLNESRPGKVVCGG